MSKDAYYFSHDSNARNDEKILAVRMKHKAAGYGVFFMILERLRESKDYQSIKDYNVLAFDFRVESAMVKSIIEDFGLFDFSEDGKFFFSKSLNSRMDLKDNISEKRREAANKRWSKNEQQNLSESEIDANAMQKQCNKRKGKESKVNLLLEKEAKGSLLEKNPNNDYLKNNEQRIAPGPAKNQFTKPSIKELEDYFLEKQEFNYRQQAQNFMDHYESNGWKVGSNQMKDWKAAVRKWITRTKEFTTNGKSISNSEPKVGRMSHTEIASNAQGWGQ